MPNRIGQFAPLVKSEMTRSQDCSKVATNPSRGLRKHFLLNTTPRRRFHGVVVFLREGVMKKKSTSAGPLNLSRISVRPVRDPAECAEWDRFIGQHRYPDFRRLRPVAVPSRNAVMAAFVALRGRISPVPRKVADRQNRECVVPATRGDHAGFRRLHLDSGNTLPDQEFVRDGRVAADTRGAPKRPCSIWGKGFPLFHFVGRVTIGVSDDCIRVGLVVHHHESAAPDQVWGFAVHVS